MGLGDETVFWEWKEKASENKGNVDEYLVLETGHGVREWKEKANKIRHVAEYWVLEMG